MLTVVTGPPCAGKTTYVRNNAKPGDIIIDFDPIAQALGSPDPHDHPAAHLRVTRAAWIAAASAARNAGVPTWLIHAHPTAADRKRYTNWGARIITIDPGETVVRDRANRERSPLTSRHVDQWYRR